MAQQWQWAPAGVVMAALLLVGMPSAVAQDAGGEEAGGTEAGEAAAPTTGGGDDGGPVVVSDLERNRYWGGRRDVSVVQKRLFTKDGRLEVTAYSGVVPNDPFLTYLPVGARIGYYFVESIGVEVSGSFSGGSLQLDSGLADDLRNDEDINANVTLLDRQQYRVNAAVSWSPFYGKFALLDSRLSNFDIYLVGGLGLVVTESPDVNADTGREETEVDPKPEGVLGIGMRFFVNEYLSLRLDYRQGIFEKVGGGVSTPSEISLGVSFFLLGD
ncbi:MAG: outer membrane beta-barrel domain-containing protein [Myxococcota bacterium]